MLQLSDDALVEVARQLAKKHSALGKEHGYLDLAYYIPLEPTKEGGCSASGTIKVFGVRHH